jgi:hypothetical protein
MTEAGPAGLGVQLFKSLFGLVASPAQEIGVTLRTVFPDLPDKRFDFHCPCPSTLKIVQGRRECNRFLN